MSDDKKKDNNHINDIRAEWAGEIGMHANNFKKAGLPPNIVHQDLHFAGFHGLMEAFHDFKPGMGAKFTTYAAHKIKGRMQNHIKDNAGVDNTHIRDAEKWTKANVKPKSEDS